MFSIVQYFQNSVCTLDSKIERVRLSKKKLIYFDIEVDRTFDDNIIYK